MASKHTTRTYTVVPLADIQAADVVGEDGSTSNAYIDSCLQTSKDSLRLSVDGTQAVLKWEGETPSVLASASAYTHAEILTELAKPSWSPTVSGP